MKKQFIPYKSALELKNLGFSAPCLLNWYVPDNSSPILEDVDDDIISNYYIKAPLWQQAFDWFREKHNILGNVYANASGYLFEWHDAEGGTHRGDSDFDGPNDSGVWDTYQEAREALLIRLISIIKKS